ncbi:leukotriene C4 synthase isoform X2 [Simochromis diagramma]|uniref:leukotriene C4 synthase isoform X2 n=1 Tax=Simochromis diagramma TaxID=43689 RepID=UPI001A7E78A6|nr:leukotriene C4 synthase isoform X2 [Simochromis diagramma]
MMEELVGLGAVTLLGVLEQAYFSLQVIYARRKYSVSPPATTGPPEFERVFRAQANCSEYFPIFITVLWLSGVFFSQGEATEATEAAAALTRTLYDLKSLAPLYFCAQILWILIGFSAVGIFLTICQVYLNMDLLQELCSILGLF